MATRNTGYAGSSSSWSASFTNIISNTITTKCDIGSVRCGKNSYSGNSDDGSHTGDSYKNDNKYFY